MASCRMPPSRHIINTLNIIFILICMTEAQTSLKRGRRYERWGPWNECPSHCKFACYPECIQYRFKRCVLPGLCDVDIQRNSKSCGKCIGSNRPTLDGEGYSVRTNEELVSLDNMCLDVNNFTPWGDWSGCFERCFRVRSRLCITEECRTAVKFAESEALLKSEYCIPANRSLAPQCEPLLERNIVYPLMRKSECQAKITENLNKTSGSHVYLSEFNPTRKRKDKIVHGDTIPLGVQCGVRNVNKRVLRIIGGNTVENGEWPWQVAIMVSKRKNHFNDFNHKLGPKNSRLDPDNFTDDSRYVQYCGGTLISPEWVLTAAHCVQQRETRGRKPNMAVLVGETDLRVMRNNTGSWQNNIYQIKEVKAHEQFEWDFVNNDIALIKLDRPVKKSPTTAFACVPDQEMRAPAGADCIAVGWGKIKKGDKLRASNRLREATLPLVGRTTCKVAFNFTVTRNQMCAGYPDGRSDSCDGDSGGPLLCLAKTPTGPRWTIYGITSFGPNDGCGIAGKYGVYTKVNNYSKWMNDLLNGHNQSRPGLNLDGLNEYSSDEKPRHELNDIPKSKNRHRHERGRKRKRLHKLLIGERKLRL